MSHWGVPAWPSVGWLVSQSACHNLQKKGKEVSIYFSYRSTCLVCLSKKSPRKWQLTKWTQLCKYVCASFAREKMFCRKFSSMCEIKSILILIFSWHNYVLVKNTNCQKFKYLGIFLKFTTVGQGGIPKPRNIQNQLTKICCHSHWKEYLLLISIWLNIPFFIF